MAIIIGHVGCVFYFQIRRRKAYKFSHASLRDKLLLPGRHTLTVSVIWDTINKHPVFRVCFWTITFLQWFMYVRVTTSLPCGTAVDVRHVAQCDNLTKIESESEETSASLVVVKEEPRQTGVRTSLVLRGLPQLAFTLPSNRPFHCTISLCNSKPFVQGKGKGHLVT